MQSMRQSPSLAYFGGHRFMRAGFGMGRRTSGGFLLGQSAQEWFNRAAAALKAWDNLVGRVQLIANVAVRAEITEWIGHPDIDGTPAYRAMTVGSDHLHDVAAEGVGAYNKTKRQDRVQELEDYLVTLREKVAKAEQEYGVIPPPAKAPPGGTTTIIRGPDIGTPIAIGAGALAVAILVSALV